MDKGIRETVKRYIDSVARHQSGLISAFIFGSYARNMQRSESDIDVALVIDDLADNERFDTQVRLMLLAAQIDTRIEPHPISKKDLDSNNPFAVEIRKTGIKLKVK
ncbi:MAG: DNA polymerase beta domain-containing [Prolixibacteraceae bacterium]|jgi:predicted nucleotidyltransferase|nr:MAG: DNA polymerase beta domain-containing [Prolixibacteraceae bacterium]